ASATQPLRGDVAGARRRRWLDLRRLRIHRDPRGIMPRARPVAPRDRRLDPAILDLDERGHRREEGRREEDDRALAARRLHERHRVKAADFWEVENRGLPRREEDRRVRAIAIPPR